MQKNNIPYELSDYVLGNYFRATGEHQGWLNDDNDPVIIAVSGGGDSIALLWLFRRFYAGKIIAVHINHGIRGQESDGDMNFTEEFSRSIGVEFLPVIISVPSERMKGESLESAARRIRLHNLCETAITLNIKNIMLGHNRDDLAETVLFNILRGTGIRGSVGMTERTEHKGITFYRPLLGLRRQTLRDILRVRNISWREDSSNNDDHYTRNYIRLKLLPLIETNINTSAVEHLAEFGEEMRALREREDNNSLNLLNECLEDNLTLNRRTLRTFDDNGRALVIREIGRRLGLTTLSRKRCDELSGLIVKPKGFIFQWCRGLTVKGIKGRIYFDDKRGDYDE